MQYHLSQTHTPFAGRAEPISVIPARPATDFDPKLYPRLHGVSLRLPALSPRRLLRQPRALLQRGDRWVRLGTRSAERRLRHERRPPQGGEQEWQQRPQRGRAVNEVLAGQQT